MLKEIVQDLKTRQNRRDQYNDVQSGMRGLSKGNDPHLFDVSRMVLESWNAVADLMIGRCWVKSKYLPPSYEAEVNVQIGKMTNESNIVEERELVEMFSKLTIEVHQTDPYYEHTHYVSSKSEIWRWLHIELDMEIFQAMTEEALQDLEDDR